MELMDSIIQDLVAEIDKQNNGREASGMASLPHYSIKVLGQMSLLMDPDAVKVLPLAVTYDLDALLVAPRENNELRGLVKGVLAKRGLEYDDLSQEIWIPPAAKFLPYFKDYHITIERLDPISALTTKAIKAKDKNRQLVKAAIGIYGKELTDRIVANGGELEFFTKQQRITL